MLRDMFAFLGRLYTMVLSVILAFILGFVTYGCWRMYEETKQQNRFANEGQLLTVTVNEEDYTQRSWRDMLGNSKYLSFRYQGKPYQVRYVTDTTFVGPGDRVQLLYHPDYDAFRQPGNGSLRFQRDTTKSRLINWSVVNSFSSESSWLMLCLVCSAAFFFYGSGVIVMLTGLTFLQSIARIMLVVILLGISGFLTYDSWMYYHYYQHLKANGHTVSVIVIDTDRTTQTGRRSSIKTYTYRATIRYQQQKRIILISEDDYERLKPNDTLQAYYDESVNDFMSVDNPLDYWHFLAAAFFWLITAIIGWNILFSQKSIKSLPTKQ